MLSLAQLTLKPWPSVPLMPRDIDQQARDQHAIQVATLRKHIQELNKRCEQASQTQKAREQDMRQQLDEVRARNRSKLEQATQVKGAFVSVFCNRRDRQRHDLRLS